MGSIVLTVFAGAIILFQMSCSKSAEAQTSPYTLPPATTSTLGGVIVGTGLTVNSSGVLSTTSSGGGLTQKNLILYVKNFFATNAYEYWLANIDGTSQQKINITLPSNLTLRSEAKLSPDGTKVIFTVNDSSTGNDAVYSVSATGGTPTKIIDGSSTARIYINGVY